MGAPIAALAALSTILGSLAGVGAEITGIGEPATPAAAQTTATCGFADPGTGTYASTLCWLDLSGYNQSLATSASGQAMSVSLPGGYTITFHLHVSGSLPVTPVAFPTFGDAYLGNDGHYTGVPGKPALYQTRSGTTTATLDDITVVDVHGAAMTGYAFVGADAESTDSGESITWTSNNPLSLISSIGNACNSGALLTGLGTTTVKCAATVSGHKTGTAILAAQASSSLSQTMVGGGLQAVAFGVLVSTIQLTKDVVRSPYLSPSDAFSVSVASASAPGSALSSADTGTGDSATTGRITVLTSNQGSNYILSEQPEGVTNPSDYSTSWSCSRNGAPDPDLPSGDAGSSATVSVGIGDFVDCTITNAALPVSIALDKRAGTPTDVNHDGLTDAGDTIDYTFIVTNTGALALQQVSVSDPMVGTVTCPSSTLSPGDSETCTASPYTITTADDAHGSVDNTATASGVVEPGYTPVTAQSSTSTPTETPDPSISLSKVADASHGDDVAPNAGDSIQYFYVVTNTGNVDLTSVNVTDTQQPTIGAIDCPESTLAPGESEECKAELAYVVTPADITRGYVTDTATAYGTPPNSVTPVDSPSTVTVGLALPHPLVAVAKTGVVSPPADQDAARAGDRVAYSYVVTNIGNVDLSSVSVQDPTIGAVTCPDLTTTPLAPGGTVTCTAEQPYTVTQADVDAGSFSDTATAAGVDTTGGLSPESEPSTVTIRTVTASPHLAIVKKATVLPAGDHNAARLGDTIVYSYDITNTGNVTMSSVDVDDPTAGHVSCPLTTLAPGESTTCVADIPRVVSQADIEVGHITDTAIVSGVPPGSPPLSPWPSDPSTVTTRTDESPRVAIAKSGVVSPYGDQDAARLGDTIAYSYEITNSGDVTLRSIAVDDPSLGAVTCPALPPGGLAPNGTITCTADRVRRVTQADMNMNRVTDTATATGVDLSGTVTPRSDPSTVVIPTASEPAVRISKTATVTPAADQDAARLGDTIAYSYEITNIGNVYLASVAVSDPSTGEVDCPALPPGGMSLGSSVTCRAEAVQTVSAADVAAGHLSDTATATGTDPGGLRSPASAPSTVTVPVVSGTVELTSIQTDLGRWAPFEGGSAPVGPTGRVRAPGTSRPRRSAGLAGWYVLVGLAASGLAALALAVLGCVLGLDAVRRRSRGARRRDGIRPGSRDGVRTGSRDGIRPGSRDGIGRPERGYRLRICLAAASALAVAAPIGFVIGTHVPSSGVSESGPVTAPARTPGRSTGAPERPGTPDTAKPGAPALVIPSLGVDAPLVASGAIGDPGYASLTVPSNIGEVGWWDGKLREGTRDLNEAAPAPGEPGVAIVAGHVDSAAAGPGALYRLDDLRAGQAIRVTDLEGTATRWRVVGSPVTVPKSELPKSLFSVSGPAVLALVTCGGPFDWATGHYEDNVIVRADLVS